MSTAVADYSTQGIVGVDAHGTKVRSSIEFKLGTTARSNSGETLIYVLANEDIANGASVDLGIGLGFRRY